MTEIAFHSAARLSQMLAEKQVSARELIDLYLARIEEHDPKVNAIVWKDAEAARAEADASDARRANGDLKGPLDGIPISVKESFDLTGSPTTWGVPEFRDNIASSDSNVVARYRAAGGNVFAKTNVPFMLADWQSFNEIYGTANNPWDVTRTPGGSSGGTAVALATGMSALDAGSDIGASIRNPAHYCGIYGHKPTMDIVSGRGQALPGDRAGTDIAVVGPMTRSTQDLKLALGILAGSDAAAARGWTLNLPAPRKTALKDFKVSVVINDAEADVDQPVQDAILALAKWLEGEGATVVMDARPPFTSTEAMEIYTMLLRSATSKRMTDAMVDDARSALANLPASASAYRRRMLEAQLMGHRDWLRWNDRRQGLNAGWETFFQEFDLMLCPTASSDAFPHDHEGERHDRLIEVNGKRVPVTDQLFWAGYFGVSYLPGTVAPIGLTPAGLPVGVQIVGREFDDLTCLHMAGLIEEGYYAFTPPPGY